MTFPNSWNALRSSYPLVLSILLITPLFALGQMEEGKSYAIHNVLMGNTKYLQLDYQGHEITKLVLGRNVSQIYPEEQLWQYNGQLKNKILSGIMPHDLSQFYFFWEWVPTDNPYYFKAKYTGTLRDDLVWYVNNDGAVTFGTESQIPNSKAKLWEVKLIGPTYRRGIQQGIPNFGPPASFQMPENHIASNYLRSVGKLKAKVLFVDFQDIHGAHYPGEVTNPILNFDKVSKVIEKSSNGRLEITFDLDGSGWHTLPQNASHYKDAYGSLKTHQDFVQQVLDLYDQNVSFYGYNFIVIVTPPSRNNLRASSNLSLDPPEGIIHDRSRHHFFATLGSDIYTHPYPEKVLLHEIGHLFGLPDLYPPDEQIKNRRPGSLESDYSIAGSWGLMSDAYRATDFLAWHKHLLGWHQTKYLEKGRFWPVENSVYITRGKHRIRLNSSYYGYHFAAIPLGKTDKPGKVLVIEPAPLIESIHPDQKHTRGGAGIIAYVVDFSLGTGGSPIEVICPRGLCQFSPSFGNRSQATIHPRTLGLDLSIDGTSVQVRLIYLFESVYFEKGQFFYIADVTVTPSSIVINKRNTVPLKTFQFGNQTWLAEDLNIEVEGAVCYQNNKEYCEKYGRMYSWEAAKKACAAYGEGWRLPSDADWKALTRHYGGAYGDQNDGKKAYENLALGGSTGFDGNFGGKRYYFMDHKAHSFYDIGKIGYYWTSDARNENEILSYTFRSTDQMVLRESITKPSFIPCRCVRDDAK